MSKNKPTHDIIRQLKRRYNVTPDNEKGREIPFQLFSIFDMGETFKRNYCWRMERDGKMLHLVSIRVTHLIGVGSPDGGYTLVDSSKWLCCYCEFKNLPDAIILRNMLMEKVANLFRRKSNKSVKFGKRYVIDTKDITDVFFNSKLINLFDNATNLSLEIVDNKCLLINEGVRNVENVVAMVEIMSELLEIDNRNIR